MGQDYLSGNGADFAMVFKLENICGTDVGSKANDGGASRWCSFPHDGGFPPPPCELAADQYREGFQPRPRFSGGRYRTLEPDDGKLSSPVLRGLAPSNGGWLLGRELD
jgi:hypothetical protein